LITHLIGVDVCMARQRGFYHKCHRCLYRGKPANWEPATTNGTLPTNGVSQNGTQNGIAAADRTAGPVNTQAMP
jgi:hypothetical protein